MRKLLVLSLITVAILISLEKADAAATVIWVNDNAANYTAPGTDCDLRAGYKTIQAAISAAAPGDTIKVCPGMYVENIAINKANLTLASTNGAPVTTIRAAFSYYVVFITQPRVTLSGFSIVPAGFADADIGVNVAIEGNASAEIANNVIVRGRIGINLGCSSRASTVYRNTVNGASETGINVDTCEYGDELTNPGSSDNSVHHNLVCGGLQPYSIATGGGTGTHNHIHHNNAIWISVYGAGNHAHHNTAELFNIKQDNLNHDNVVAKVCP
jgi:hypothetical protein